jgi:glycosyltransferase involved in cell wall biosynthesis
MATHASNGKRIAYFFTSFPKLSERFLQRELEGLDQYTELEVELHALIGKGCSGFGSYPVIRFTVRDWLRLPFCILRELIRKPAAFYKILSLSVRCLPKSFINTLEHYLGLAYAVVRAAEFRRDPPDSMHAVWATGPASAAFFLHLINGTPFSMGCHAYDLFRNGGDMWLSAKSLAAKFIHTSTTAARDELIRRGAPAEKIHLIRRSAPYSPLAKAAHLITPSPNHGSQLTTAGNVCKEWPIRILSVGRLIEKKGYFELLEILWHLKSENLPFTARIIGDGPLRKALQQRIAELDLGNQLALAGSISFKNVEKQMWESTDLFLFTGKQAASGDRDGLPNVIIEAMVAGIPVLASPSGAVEEAIQPGLTGELLDPRQPELWACAIHKIVESPSYADALRQNARHWVATHCDAGRNAKTLSAHLVS